MFCRLLKCCSLCNLIQFNKSLLKIAPVTIKIASRYYRNPDQSLTIPHVNTLVILKLQNKPEQVSVHL